MSASQREGDNSFTTLRSLFIFFLVLLALAVAIAVGACLFLFGMAAVAELRGRWRWLALLAPGIGLLSGWAFSRIFRASANGNQLVVGLLRNPHATASVPPALAPVIVVATWLSHLVGMSVGREGTAVQMGAGLSDSFSRLFGYGSEARRVLLLAGVAGGFSAVFGVPIAGAVFAIEVSRRKRPAGRDTVADIFSDTSVGTDAEREKPKPRDEFQHRPSILKRAYEFAACLFVALVANVVAQLLGATHSLHGFFTFSDAFLLPELGSLFLTGIACGLTAWAFLFLLHTFKIFWARLLPAEMWRPAIGGAVFGAALFFAHVVMEPYASLGVDVIQEALANPAHWYDPLAKSVATIFSIGVGFKGGEVTPLFFIGATAGSAIAGLLGAQAVVAGGVGLVTCFGAAAGVPVAAAAMAGEIFGPAAFILALPICLMANWICRHSRLYDDIRGDIRSAKPQL